MFSPLRVLCRCRKNLQSSSLTNGTLKATLIGYSAVFHARGIVSSICYDNLWLFESQLGFPKRNILSDCNFYESTAVCHEKFIFSQHLTITVRKSSWRQCKHPCCHTKGPIFGNRQELDGDTCKSLLYLFLIRHHDEAHPNLFFFNLRILFDWEVRESNAMILGMFRKRWKHNKRRKNSEKKQKIINLSFNETLVL